MRPRNMIAFAALAGSAATLLGLRSAFRRDMARVTAGLDSASRLVSTDFGAVEYGREGAGSAVLVSHGAGGGFDQGLFVGRELIGRNHDVIAPSRFGYLRSGSPSHPFPSVQADAYAELLDRLGIAGQLCSAFRQGPRVPSKWRCAIRSG